MRLLALLTFAKDGKLTGEWMGSKKAEGEFKIDPAAKPKTLDLTFEGTFAPGVYELSGDTLKLCCHLGAPDTEKFTRPEEMKADQKKEFVVLIFKRVKDEPKKDK